jgi:hypothetical protein
MSAFASPHEWEHPRPLWIVLLLLSLWISWPFALALFVVLLWTGRLDTWKHAAQNMWQDSFAPIRQSANWWSPRSSGNHAFDDYRSDMLRRLEEEEKEFRQFLNRLRAAKDKSEFDQFMADRRRQAGTPTQSPQ